MRAILFLMALLEPIYGFRPLEYETSVEIADPSAVLSYTTNTYITKFYRT